MQVVSPSEPLNPNMTFVIGSKFYNQLANAYIDFSHFGAGVAMNDTTFGDATLTVKLLAVGNTSDVRTVGSIVSSGGTVLNGVQMVRHPSDPAYAIYYVNGGPGLVSGRYEATMTLLVTISGVPITLTERTEFTVLNYTVG